MNRKTALSATAAAAIALAGCSSSGTAHHTPPPSSATATGPHNAADVAFATNMIPHHRQAVAMADLVAGRAANPTVTALATEIKGAQSPEITEMSAWLTGWGRPVPTDHMSMGGGSMPGMMSATEMTALGKATGSTFDRLWVTMMLAHHAGALTMARTELAAGTSTAAKALASSIVRTQKAEITRMRTLLSTLPS